MAPDFVLAYYIELMKIIAKNVHWLQTCFLDAGMVDDCV
jgi:hypothetical protein